MISLLSGIALFIDDDILPGIDIARRVSAEVITP